MHSAKFGNQTQAAEVLLRYPLALKVFERLNLPLSLGDKTIDRVATEAGVTPALLLNLLYVSLFHSQDELFRLEPSDLPAIVSYLEQSHHYYSLEATPEILRIIHTIGEATTSRTHALVENFFQQYSLEVDRHFSYENEVAFPYIRRLLRGPHAAINGYSIREYKQQHNDIEDKLSDLQNLLIRYLSLEEPYHLRRQLFIAIHLLGEDLSAHTCIENRILIPLVEKEEAKWKK